MALDLNKIFERLETIIRYTEDKDIKLEAQFAIEDLQKFYAYNCDEVENLAKTLEEWHRAQWSFKHIAYDLIEYRGIRGEINFETYHEKLCEKCKQNSCKVKECTNCANQHSCTLPMHCEGKLFELK